MATTPREVLRDSFGISKSPVSDQPDVTFGPFRLCPAARCLLRTDGHIRHIRLSPRAFDLLRILVAERPKALAKDDLLGRLWPEKVANEGNLAVLVSEVRRALNDDPKKHTYLRTVHGFGYAFHGGVGDTPAERPDGTRVFRLYWDGRVLTLPLGTHVIGRTPASPLLVPEVEVSRRHAAIEVTNGSAVLKDLGSRNGTFRNGSRVTEPVVLADGDVIEVGSARMTVRVVDLSAETV